jgi:hypothetical protein
MLLGMTGDPTSTPRARRGVVTFVLLAAGLALLVWMARRLDLDWADVQDGFGRIGLWFAAILALSFGRFVLRSYAWMALTAHPIPLRTAVAATISGDALGNITPLGLAASEPAKALYLRRHAPPGDTLASLTAENFFYSVSVAIYVMVGTAAMLAFFDLKPAVHFWGVVSLVGMAAVLAGAAWLAWQQPTVVSSLLARIPIARLRALVEHVRAFEQQTYGSAGHQGSRLVTVAACELSFHALSFVECWLSFWLLTGVSALLPALVFDAFNRVVNIVFKQVPFRAGVEEGGTALLADAIGYSARGGFLLGLVRKVRVIAWAGVGLWLWARNAGD